MHPNRQRVIDALRANPEPLIDWAADALAALGAKSEWSMDDNFETTEGLARMAEAYDLPAAGDQPEEALIFWGHIADELGYPYDADLPEDDEPEGEPI